MSFFDFGKKKRIFLDYASTTPIHPEVKKVVRDYEDKSFANPSALYTEAIFAKEKLTEARKKISEILNCQKENIIFTSGGTEGNNLAILGVFSQLGSSASKLGGKLHFITTEIEHPSVLDVFREIEIKGGEVTRLKVDSEGLVSLKDLREALRSETVLVSIMYANNEIGTIQPIKEIGKVIKDWRHKNATERERLRNNDSEILSTQANVPYFHTDACQAPLYLLVDVLKLGVDMMTLDGIKMYGPRSSGILYVKSDVEISPMIFGGGQERGLRSGTEDVAKSLGFAKALEIAVSLRETESERLKEIRDYGIDLILKTFPKASLNGSKENRLPNNINICFPGLDAEFAVISLDVNGISCSYSSSCITLKDDSSSYVVEALGRPECKLSSLRFTLGRGSTKIELNKLIAVLKKVIK